MNQPAEPLQLSQKEQGRLLARVYAFILSDQFIGKPQEQINIMDTVSAEKNKIQTTGDTQLLDAETIPTQEPVL